jgi:hypothetical protein
MKQDMSRGVIVPAALAASVILGLLAMTGMYLLPKEEAGIALKLTPNTYISTPGETFTIEIVTTSDIPVNAFKGTVLFNETVLEVASIDYNISVADLWAEAPWYEDGDGSINFAGGTLRPGGFTGTESLLTITFKALQAGNGDLVLRDTQILMHDGAGTEATLTNYIDTLFVVENETVASERIEHETMSVADVLVLSKAPTPDLTSDGQVTIADVSIFLLLLPTGNLQADFNNDGKVNTADLSILLEARTE